MSESTLSGGDEPVVRSFLAGAGAMGVANVGRSPAPAALDDAVVRPYTVTGGRTSSSNVAVRFESIIVATDEGRAATMKLSPELERILEEANRPRSVVEVADRARLPLGVVLVLAGDAVTDGYLRSSATSPVDKSFVARVREAVNAL